MSQSKKKKKKRDNPTIYRGKRQKKPKRDDPREAGRDQGPSWGQNVSQGRGGQQTAQTAGVGNTGARSYQKKKGVGVCPHLFVVNSKQKATSEEQ